MGKGIDYGMGTTNIDRTNGIRFGVISVHSLSQWALEDFEPDYGEPTCPKCGNEASEGEPEEGLTDDDTDLILEGKANLGFPEDSEHDVCEDGSVYVGLVQILPVESIAQWEHARHECADYHCENCHYVFGSESAFGDEPAGGFVLDDGEYVASLDSYNDVFIVKSPYFTRAQFCSPCAPGACHLDNPCDDGERAYCFGHEWFEDGKAPYPVFSMATGEEIKAPQK